MERNDASIVVWDAITYINLNIILAPGDYRKIIEENKDFNRLVIANPFQVNIYDTVELSYINTIRDQKEIYELNRIYILSE
jgi:hypothetical protein